MADDGPVVVDVKPRHRLEQPKISFTFAWTREVVESRGWQYEVWSEPDPMRWRTSASPPAIAGTGCSTKLSLRACGPWGQTEDRWGKPCGCCLNIPGGW
ncbi:hypothetical protein [Streptomyces sp. NBC_00842]|uniref:hypothetical protein n=1 Tax=Streptomyces sp. NBC_00842 TaxID=2975848 RepID=UPI00386CB04D